MHSYARLLPLAIAFLFSPAHAAHGQAAADTKACPAGWRVPSEEDWRALERGLGMPDAEIGKEDGRAAPAGRRLKFGGDTGFNSAIRGGLIPTWPTAPGRWAATVWHRDVAANRNSIWRSPST
jgi:uncharacterized protein (TIGR02145 family)